MKFSLLLYYVSKIMKKGVRYLVPFWEVLLKDHIR